MQTVNSDPDSQASQFHNRIRQSSPGLSAEPRFEVETVVLATKFRSHVQIVQAAEG